jgi:phosphinothricin acetyltransferase
MIIIRNAKFEDLKEITYIYNNAILKTTATFDVKPKTISEQILWFKEHNSNYPIIVAEKEEEIAGWASLSLWSDRCAYSKTAEISIYIKEKYRGKGIGKKIIYDILTKGKEAGLHTIIARISGNNKASNQIFEKSGFKHIGTMREVGKKFNKLIDVHLMQKIYETNK